MKSLLGAFHLKSSESNAAFTHICSTSENPFNVFSLFNCISRLLIWNFFTFFPHKFFDIYGAIFCQVGPSCQNFEIVMPQHYNKSGNAITNSAYSIGILYFLFTFSKTFAEQNCSLKHDQ